MLTGQAVGRGIVAAALMALGSSQAYAQAANSYFPAGTSGYNQDLGVTVLSRLRPLYASSGVQAGTFVIRPRIDESLFFNSNPNGTSPSKASAGVRTSAGVAADSDWRRDSAGITVGVDDFRYFSLPRNSYTDWNIGLRGGLTVRDSELAAAYSHQEYHQLGTTIAAIASSTPVLDTVDTARINYTVNLSRFSFTPDVSASAYRFGTATAGGAQIDQSFLDRNVVAAGVATRYSMSDVGGLLFIVRTSSANYLHRLPGQPTNNSTSLDLLTGVDYQAKGVWRYRLLVGFELQTYQAAQYSSQTATIVEGSVIWTPSGRTTVTASILRNIQSPQTAGNNGYVLTAPKLVTDFELRRNILLQARGGMQSVEYLQGGNQTNLTAGFGANLLFNPRLRTSLDVDYVKQVGSSRVTATGAVSGGAAAGSVAPSSVTTGPFEQTVIALTLHYAL